LIEDYKLKIILLGTGGPRPDPNRQGPSIIIKLDNNCLLIDAGRGVTTQIARAGIKVTDLDSIFITHHHFDHICGLADLLFAAWISGRKEEIQIYGPKDTSEIVQLYFNRIYHKDITFRLKESSLGKSNVDDIRNIINVNEISPGLIYNQDDCKVYAYYVEHGHGLGMTIEEWPCYGYRFELDGKIVAISGDAIFCSNLIQLSKDADILIQCAYLADVEIKNHFLDLISKHVLASSLMAGEIAASARVKKLVLTHIRQKNPKLLQSMIKDVRRHYDGPVIIGEDLMEIK